MSYTDALVIPDDIDIWERIDIRKIDECWPPGGKYLKKDPGERSQVPRIEHEGHQYAIKRVAYKYANDIYGPSGLQFVDVMTKCNNPECCNPLHLTAGDEAVARLTQEEIEEIHESDAPREEIMEEYGIENERFVGYIRSSEL